MKNSSRKWFQLLAVSLVSLFFVGALPWRELRADANTHGEYDCFPLLVVYDQTSSWDLTTQGEFVITNYSDSLVESWRLEINFTSDLNISNLWNAQDLRTETTPANILVIGNEVYNSTILPGESVSFGLDIDGVEFAPVSPVSVTTIGATLSEAPVVYDDSISEESVDDEVQSEEQIQGTEPVTIEDDGSLFPYAIFANSDITFSGWKSNIVGDVYSGGNYIYQGSELSINGYVRTVGYIQPPELITSMTGSTENVLALEMPDWSELILSKTEIMNALSEDDLVSQDTIIANGYYRTDGSVTISSTEFGGDVVIIAGGDITINMSTLSGDGRILLYSENGNITINGSQATFNGILYAPNGSVSLNAYDMTVNGRIVADQFSYSGSILNVTADDTDLQLYEALPDVRVVAWADTVSVEERIGYTITVPEETSYEILYRLNGEEVTVDIPEGETTGYYSFDASEAGEYSFIAYVSLPYGEYELSRATVNVVEVEPTVTPSPTATPTAEPTATPTPSVTPTVTPEPTVTVTPTPTVTPTITVTPVPTPTPIADPFEIVDSDSDGLLDYLETMCGTDINNPDTDGDGLLDGDEIIIMTSPLNTDSDLNGISDFDEDFDEDGLTNGQEYSTDTCMFLYDTDFDGVNDYDELYVHGTNPQNEDSDGDSITDGDEVILGLTPNSNDSDGDGVNDDYETSYQSLSLDITESDHPHTVTSVEISGAISGLITSNTTIEDVYNLDVYCTDVVGLVGVPISIESKGHFDSMTLTINYDDSNLGDTSENDLGVLWHDETTGFFEIQTQAQIDTDNNVVTVELSHFSTYLLVDLSAYREAITAVGHETVQSESEDVNYNIMFAIDTSVSMDAEERNEAIAAINSILGDLRTGDRVSFCYETTYSFGYSNYVDASRVPTVSSSWERYIRSNRYSGQSNMAAFNDAAADIFYYSGLTDADTNKNIIIYITDENSTYNNSLGGLHVIGPLNDYYALFVGNTSNPTVTSACSRLRGWACQASSARIHQIVQHGNSLGTVMIDNDGDGIPDSLEIEGILATNGKTYYLDPEQEDSDDDTLTDLEEIGAIYSVTRSVDGRDLTISINGIVVYSSQYGSISSDSQYYFLESFANTVQPGETAEICVPFSDPNMPDSDEDGYLDYEDARPNRVNPDMIYFFANPDFYYLGANRANMYREVGFQVTFKEFSDVESFEFVWEGIGLHDTYYVNGNKPYGDRYYYNPHYVVIDSHGCPSGFCLSSRDNDNCSYLRCASYRSTTGNILKPSLLMDKKIESLNLYICSGGAEYSEGDNIAVDFLVQIPGIQQVIAADATLWFFGDNRYFFKDYNAIRIIEPDLYAAQRYVFLRSSEFMDPWFCTNPGHHVNGFEVFTRENPPVDYYSTDVIYGTLLTTIDNQGIEGIVTYDPCISDQVGYVYYDPIIY